MLIDLNCDLGEGCPHDAELMTLVTSANVACGGHVSADLVAPTLALARQHGVRVGAHPGFIDPEHFGRRELDLPPERVYEDVREQLARIGPVARYLKPHGALYNMACRDERLAEPLVRLAAERGLSLVALPESRLEVLSKGRCDFVREGFADRRYRPDGSLVPRGQADAFVEEPGEAVEQADRLIQTRGVRTLCVHGDNPHALAFVRALREGLMRRGYEIAAF